MIKYKEQCERIGCKKKATHQAEYIFMGIDTKNTLYLCEEHSKEEFYDGVNGLRSAKEIYND